jgi:hypothetical protein
MDAASLKEYIKDKRPNLTQSSINTYTSILRSLHKGVFGTPDVTPKNFNQTKKIMAYLKDVPPNKRKTTLSGLVVLSDNKQYRDLMLSDIKDYKDTISKNEKSEAQREAWVTEEDIAKKYKELEKDANMLFSKDKLTNAELQRIQNYVILSVLGGMHIPVRRSKDYVDFKIRNIDKDKDNYMDKNKFYFNSYKTAKSYGLQKVTIPKKLQNIIKKWIAVIPEDVDHLLFDAKRQGLGGPENKNGNGSVKLNQRIQKIFEGKKVGVNGLRHSSLTEKFAPMIEAQKKADSVMKDMGSSSEMLGTYVKTD